MEKLLKGMDSSLSLSTVESERVDLEKRVHHLEKRHTLLRYECVNEISGRHVCEEFVNEAKEQSDIARAMQVEFPCYE